MQSIIVISNYYIIVKNYVITHVVDFTNEKWSFTFTIIITIDRFSRLFTFKQKVLKQL